jgi:hypothetical protein
MHDLSDVLKVYNINNSITKCWPLNSFADFNTIANTSKYLIITYVNELDSNGNPNILSQMHSIFIFFDQNSNTYIGYNNGRSSLEYNQYLWQFMSGSGSYSETDSKKLFVAGCVIKE